MSEEHVRLFVALELPEEIRAALIAWRDEVLRSVRGLRALAPQSLHVTLCFLGWQDGAAVTAIETACEEVSSCGAARLSLQRGIWLPPRRPRVLAVELSDAGDALGDLQSRLSAELERGGWYQPEARPFLAHVTAARAVKGERVRADELPPLPPLRFAGTRITLFRSRLLRGGAQYEPLHTVTLAGAGGG